MPLYIATRSFLYIFLKASGYEIGNTNKYKGFSTNVEEQKL